jgi:signal transduction histidine kinase
VPGSGLGLFICRGIVREHGGDVVLEDRPEGGTILRISLPWGPS